MTSEDLGTSGLTASDAGEREKWRLGQQNYNAASYPH